MSRPARESLVDGLNPAQREAVVQRGGPLLVLAGAGSGKTRVVTHRIAWRMREGLSGARILALTFTNKAASEMRGRIGALVDPDVAPPTIGTFHSISARMLRTWAHRVGRGPDFTIYDDDDQLAALKRVLKAQGITDKTVRPGEVREAFDRAKNEGRLPTARDLPPDVLVAGGERVPEAYEAELRRSNALDFGDLILRLAHLLEADAEIAETVRRRWPMVLVDEFQDTNPAQLRWLQALAPPSERPDLTVVGDDDQAIYGWRGADVRNMLRFQETWTGAEVIRLERNYRSTGHILGAANGVVEHNSERLGKTLFTEAGDGHRIEIEAFSSPREEARWVASRVRALCRDEDLAPADFAILLRTASLSLDLEEAFRANGVPAVHVRGRSFYERAEVRDAVAWLRLAVNPDDDVAYLRAAAAPPRGLGDTSLAGLASAATAAERSLFAASASPPPGLQRRARAALQGFHDLLESNRREARRADASLLDVARICVAPYLDALRDAAARASGRDEDARQRLDNVERLLDAVADYGREAPDARLGDWLERVKLVSDTDALPEGTAVSLLTVHAAKGLEFPVCFVVGFEEGTFPHGRALSTGEDGVEEERRLAYVAMTRARRRLLLSWCRERRTFAEVRRCSPSRFLAEVPREHIEARLEVTPERTSRPLGRRLAPAAADASLYADPVWDDDAVGESGWRVGMWVWHGELGKGRVVGVSHGLRTTLQVEFEGVGRRSVVATWVSPYDPS